jgi:type IV pilus assembly protein PilA
MYQYHSPTLIDLVRSSHRGSAQQAGFSLIELVVVILILGILGGMAWPTVLNQVARSKQARALHAIGAMSRAQQSDFHEQLRFSESIDELGFSYLNQGDSDYQYSVTPVNARTTTIVANPEDSSLLGYTGVVFVNRDGQQNLTLASLVCAVDHQAGAPQPTVDTTGDGQVEVINCNPL